MHKVAVTERLKIDSNDFFEGKFCTGVLGQEMVQNELLVLQQIDSLSFSDFLHNEQQLKAKNLMKCFWNISSFGVLEGKKPQNGPEMRFIKFYGHMAS